MITVGGGDRDRRRERERERDDPSLSTIFFDA